MLLLHNAFRMNSRIPFVYIMKRQKKTDKENSHGTDVDNTHYIVQDNSKLKNSFGFL